jgi:hypothetical protein
MHVREIKTQDLNAKSNHNKTEGKKKKKRFSLCTQNRLPTLLFLLFILLFPFSLFLFRSWHYKNVQRVQDLLRYTINIRKSLKFCVYSATGCNERTKLGLRSQDFLSSRLHMKIKIHSRENLKDILHVYKRIRFITDYVCMLFTNMDIVCMVQ